MLPMIAANVVAQIGPDIINAIGIVGFAAFVVLFTLYLTGRQAVQERALTAQSIRDSQKERQALEAKQQEIVREAQAKIGELYDQMLRDEREDKARLEKRVRELEKEFTDLKEQNRQREKDHREALKAMQEYQRQRESQHQAVLSQKNVELVQKDAEIEKLTTTNLELQGRVDKLENKTKEMQAEAEKMQQEINSVIGTHGYENELSRELERRLRERGADTSEIKAIRESVSARTAKKAESDNDQTDPPARGG